MTADTSRQRETAIRRRIEGWAKALHAKDLDGVLSHYAPDTVTFDLAPPLQHRMEAMRRGLAEWFPTFAGPIGWELRDLAVTSDHDVAFGHALSRLTGKRTSGEVTDVWVRATWCFRRRGGEWMIAHEHVSVPLHMDGSHRAAVDLAP